MTISLSGTDRGVWCLVFGVCAVQYFIVCMTDQTSSTPCFFKLCSRRLRLRSAGMSQPMTLKSPVKVDIFHSWWCLALCSREVANHTAENRT